MGDWATEGGHWYKRDGTPFYTVIGANGKERNTTLRDARKLDLVPSVTMILGECAKPALEAWKRQQLLLAALTLQRLPDEPEMAFLDRIQADSEAEGRAARDRGTAIHGAIERAVRGQPVEAGLAEWAQVAERVLTGACGGRMPLWEPERSFAHYHGYGGRVDLHSQDWVVDIKTKDRLTGDVALYDEHFMQLAAYRAGLLTDSKQSPEWGRRCGILFLDREHPIAVFKEASEEDLWRGAEMFDCLRRYWYAKTGLGK